MKPLSPAPLTHEDLQAYSYCYGFVEGQSWDAVMIYVRLSDRRDAALMFEAQRCRYRTFPVDMPPLELIGPAGVLVCGGAIFLPANPYPAAL